MSSVEKPHEDGPSGKILVSVGKPELPLPAEFVDLEGDCPVTFPVILQKPDGTTVPGRIIVVVNQKGTEIINVTGVSLTQEESARFIQAALEATKKYLEETIASYLITTREELLKAYMPSPTPPDQTSSSS